MKMYLFNIYLLHIQVCHILFKAPGNFREQNWQGECYVAYFATDIIKTVNKVMFLSFQNEFGGHMKNLHYIQEWEASKSFM